MPIIFGWGRQTTWNVGPVFKRVCDHCHNEEYWTLLRRTTWFTLFFIPVIPYKSVWWLLCPICKYGLELKPEQVKTLQPIAEVNQLLNTGAITVEEYHKRVAALNSSSDSTEAPATEVSMLPEAKVVAAEVKDTKGKFCGECGKEIMSEGKFCVHCGTKIN
ncbi:MAG TPA: zinc-ribbon domain-containing protein [Candidatus Paceibacterota bacterium]|nr:zinc-ribbon domain-containing protein [Candidatus Paceibacterota bacterium]